MKVYEKVFRKLRRDGLVRTFYSVLRFPFYLKRHLQYQKMLNRSSLTYRFNDIYDNNFWNSDESGSGEGSELSYTEPLRVWLKKILPKLNVKVLVDAPCGDFNWMRNVVPDVDVNYLGLDIVESVINKNTEIYGAERVQFAVANICEDHLPNCDILMTRDCLFHLSYNDIGKFLENISNVEYRYLLTTTHVVDSNFKNSDIVSGDFRLIDLFSSPFCFDQNCIFDRVNDYPKGYQIPREMVLIEKKNVPKSLSLNI